MFSAFGIDSVAGGLFQMDRNESMAEDSWRRGQENARIANEFTERMSNTAHQRAVVDLQAAGLNPLLSATKGGASAGQGAMSQAPQAAQAPDFGKMFGPNVRAENEKIQLENKNIEMDTRLKDAQRSHTSQMWNTSRAQEAYINEQTHTQRELTDQARHQAQILSNSAKGAELEGEIDSTTYGKIMRYINRSENATRMFRNLRRW